MSTFTSLGPILIFTVSGIGEPAAMPSTSRCNLAGLCREAHTTSLTSTRHGILQAKGNPALLKPVSTTQEEGYDASILSQEEFGDHALLEEARPQSTSCGFVDGACESEHTPSGCGTAMRASTCFETCVDHVTAPAGIDKLSLTSTVEVDPRGAGIRSHFGGGDAFGNSFRCHLRPYVTPNHCVCNWTTIYKPQVERLGRFIHITSAPHRSRSRWVPGGGGPARFGRGPSQGSWKTSSRPLSPPLPATLPNVERVDCRIWNGATT